MSRSPLSSLSDGELLARVKVLVSQERATTLEVLVHLNEVERQRLHLHLGYPSLFEYCTRHLGYSSSAAGRRIHAARCVRDFSEVYGLLEKKEVNLSSVSLVASILTQENKDDLLSRIRNKSQKEVEAMVADYRPRVSFRDRVRPVCVAVQEPKQERTTQFRTSLSDHSRSGSEISPNGTAGPTADPLGPSRKRESALQSGGIPNACPTSPAVQSATLRTERKLLVQFLASEAFMKKFEEVRSLLTNKIGNPSYEAVLEAALDEFLAHHSPEKRTERRENRSRSRKRQARPRKRDSQIDRPRHVPASVRDAVFQRDHGRCTYVGSTGKRCGSTHHLQIDHVVPHARGGESTFDNLRLLCERHNKREAERVLEADTIRRFRRQE